MRILQRLLCRIDSLVQSVVHSRAYVPPCGQALAPIRVRFRVKIRIRVTIRVKVRFKVRVGVRMSTRSARFPESLRRSPHRGLLQLPVAVYGYP